MEIKVLEKGLGFSPTPSSINEVDLHRDLNGFLEMKGRKMLVKHSNLRVSPLGILRKEHLQ